jgi:hypothetical protein
VTLTATVSPSAATGTVTFYDGTTSLGTGTLSSGTATLATSFSTTGTHTITATYGGSTTDATSTSSAVVLTCSSASLTSTTTALTASTTTPVAGASVTLTATVSPSAATGTVTFYDGTTSLGTGTLSSGTATLATSFSTTGTHTITAIYGGDSTYATSTSSVTTITVSSSSLTSTTTSLVSSSYSTTSESSFTLTATLSATAATGTVEFYDTTTSTELGTGSLNSGTATLTTSLSAVETHAIEAIYEGDSTYATSTSSTISVVVSASSSSATAITLSVSPTTVTAGTGVALAAIVTPVSSTGTVTFYDGSTEIGTASLVSGSAVAALTTTSLAVGSHTITAQYSTLTSSSTAVTVTTATTSGSFTSDASCGYTADGATGAEVLSSGTLSTSGQSYSTSTADQNAICVTGASTYLTLINPTISSTSVTTSDNDSSFYGLDAAVLDYNGGDLTIDGATITSSGAGGNLVYSYGTGIVTISNSTLSGTSSSASNEHGIYAAGAGTIVANNVTASSEGPSSSIVATDRGGGTVTVNGGAYSVSGGKSAGIYSTGVITAYNATFTSTAAEAVVIEGDNSVVLSNSTLNSTSSGTHRGIFLYQSMSGDATNNSCGTLGDCFEMTGGAINYTDTTSGNSDPVNNCTAFEVYNQTSLVTLTDVAINNSCGTLLLSAFNDQWTNTDAWGYATFKAYGATLTGNIIVGDTCLTTACTTRDTTSTAAIYLYEDSSSTGSALTGAINTVDTGKTVSLTLDAASKWVVTGTSYLTALTDAQSNYSNITCQTAGCKVYVNGTAISIN